jgi:hypothetical protein
VVGIFGDDRSAEMVDRIPAALVLVGQLFPQTADVTTATLKRQVAQHVIEGAVLHHQDHDVVDLLKVGPTGLLRHDTSRSCHSRSLPNCPMTAAHTANTAGSRCHLATSTE